MSKKTINFEHEVNGVPTAVTSIFLSDPTDTFGLRRQSNGAVFTANNTPIPPVVGEVGKYRIEINGLEPGVTYEYWLEWTYDGETYWQERIFTAPALVPSSTYHTWDEFKRQWGETNIAVASNKDNQEADTPDFDAVQDAFDYAAEEISNFFRGGPYAVPLDFEPNNNAVPWAVRDWAMVIAYDRLYTARGMEDKNTDRVGNRISVLRKAAYTDMSLYKGGVKQLPATGATDDSGNEVTAEVSTYGGWSDYYRAVDGQATLLIID